MTASWQVNGSDLNTSTVKVVVIPASMGLQQSRRKQTIPRLHSLPTTHGLGDNLPTWTLTFSIIGPAPDRHVVLNNLRTALKAADTFTLTAPDAPNEVYFNAGVKTVTLSLDSLGSDYATGIGDINLKVQATEGT